MGGRAAAYLMGGRAAAYLMGERAAAYLMGGRAAAYLMGGRAAAYLMGGRAVAYLIALPLLIRCHLPLPSMHSSLDMPSCTQLLFPTLPMVQRIAAQVPMLSQYDQRLNYILDKHPGLLLLLLQPAADPAFSALPLLTPFLLTQGPRPAACPLLLPTLTCLH